MPFKLHQFVSGAGTAYATLGAPGERLISLEGQQFHPDLPMARLYETRFCRSCGQEHHPVRILERSGGIEVLPRSIDDAPREDAGDDDGLAGFLMPEPAGLDFNGDPGAYPEAWQELAADGTPRLKPDRRKQAARRLYIGPDGRERADGVAAWFLPGPFRAEEAALWGLVTDGRRLRLMRDSTRLTRPAYIEANLESTFDNDDFAGFTALWLLIHPSRFGDPAWPPAECWLERWQEDARERGTAARERLRDGVEKALVALGGGVLASADVRDKIADGTLTIDALFGELLRLVYRLIFLMTAEDRLLLHAPDADPKAVALYRDGYSIARLRELAVRRSAWDRHSDLYEGVKIIFAALARGEKRLGLPALGGLFMPGDTDTLDKTRLANASLLEALFHLAWLTEKHGLVRVNWRDMQTEELGSVYESLLELTVPPAVGSYPIF